MFIIHQVSLASPDRPHRSHSQSVGGGGRGDPRRDHGGRGRRRPQLLDGVEVVLVAHLAILVEIVLEELVHRPRDGRRRRLVQHPRSQALQERFIT